MVIVGPGPGPGSREVIRVRVEEGLVFDFRLHDGKYDMGIFLLVFISY